MEMVLSHLIGDLNLKMPSSVYSSGSSTEGAGVFALSDSFVTCCTLLLLSFNTCRLTVTLFLLSPMLSGCDASSTVTACTWFMLSVALSCSQKSLKFVRVFVCAISCQTDKLNHPRRNFYHMKVLLIFKTNFHNHTKLLCCFFFGRWRKKKVFASFCSTEPLPKKK